METDMIQCSCDIWYGVDDSYFCEPCDEVMCSDCGYGHWSAWCDCDMCWELVREDEVALFN